MADKTNVNPRADGQGSYGNALKRFLASWLYKIGLKQGGAEPTGGVAGNVQLYAKADGTVYAMDAAGTERELTNQAITGKADKVTGAVAGNLAGLDVSGNLTDSGAKPANFDAAGAASAVQGNLNSHAGLSTTAHGGIVASTDQRLTDARTPIGTTLAFGNIFRGSVANVAEIVDGSTVFLPIGLKGAANGVAELGADTKLIPAQIPFGSGANTVCEGNDGRLSDARTPLAHAASHAIGVADTVFPTGSALQILRRNAANSALEFATAAVLPSSFAEYALARIANMREVAADVTVTSTVPEDIQTAIDNLTAGQILELKTNGPITLTGSLTIPAAKSFILRAAKGYAPVIIGPEAIKLLDGASDVLISGLVFDSCTSPNTHSRGSALCFDLHAKVSQIIFHDLTFRACLGDAIQLSYHQGISGDLYYADILPSEMSSKVAFIGCNSFGASNNASEGGNICMRGINIAYIAGNNIDANNLSRGILCQCCTNVLCEDNTVQRTQDGSGNGEGIKLDQIGNYQFMNTGIFRRNRIMDCQEGLDLDDAVEAEAVENIISGCFDEGISLDGGSAPLICYASCVGNICFDCGSGIRFESGSVGALKHNICFQNGTNFLMDNGYSPDASNLTSVENSILSPFNVPIPQGDFSTKIAAAALSGHRVVIVDTAGKVNYADNTNLNHANCVFGLTTGAITSGKTGRIIRQGEIEEPGWTWTAFQRIYLNGTTGQISATPPASGFLAQIGFALSPTRIMVAVLPSVILA